MNILLVSDLHDRVYAPVNQTKIFVVTCTMHNRVYVCAMLDIHFAGPKVVRMRIILPRKWGARS